MIIRSIRDPDWDKYILADGSRPLTGGFLIFGDGGNGSWQVIIDGNDLNFERKEGGIWNMKFKITAV